jgi:hypothetical protein
MSEVIGSIIHIGNTETVGSAGTFKKRLLVVKTNGEYPQEVPIDFVQDKCEVLDKYAIGESVKVDINIRGNKYNDKWYCSLNGWRIDKENSPIDGGSSVETFEVKEPIQVSAVLQQAANDLPF